MQESWHEGKKEKRKKAGKREGEKPIYKEAFRKGGKENMKEERRKSATIRISNLPNKWMQIPNHPFGR